MISCIWVVVGVVGAVVVQAAGVVPPTCSWLEYEDNTCVTGAECSDSGNVIHFWEDCAAKTKLFTITEGDVSLDEGCKYASEDNKIITLKSLLDTESDEIFDCLIVDTDNSIASKKLYFSPENVNEHEPQPAKGTDKIMEVEVPENEEPAVIATIHYQDEDKGETNTLTSEWVLGSELCMFELEPLDGLAGDSKAFNLSTLKEMDFESMMFTKLEFNIVSVDALGTRKSTLQTFLVTVKDKPDEPPYWSKFNPFYNQEECDAGVELFVVEAHDRDIDVNYEIRYTMTEEPAHTGEAYFKIDETTGMVSTNRTIDREALLEEEISTFSLLITATEYKENGDVGEEPNSSQQTSVINIIDLNDNKPTFNNASYECTIDELTSEDVDLLDLDIIVKDMDEGVNGSFTLTTSDNINLNIRPIKGQQEENVILTAAWRGDNTLFNFEIQGAGPLVFTITATEQADPNNFGTATVTVHLEDVNDNPPSFEQPDYPLEMDEDTDISTELLTVAATDDDRSSEFNADSIWYSLESCNALSVNMSSGKVFLERKADYETPTDRNIVCKVVATDMYGEGLSGYSTINITVNDVVDEEPWFVDSSVDMLVPENSDTDTVVGIITVTDDDEKAEIEFEINSTSPDNEDIKKWFKVVPRPPSPPTFEAEVRVGEEAPDRELENEVKLNIIATDKKTEAGIGTDTVIVTITIENENDEAPSFSTDTDFKDLEVDENSEADFEIYTMYVTDKDTKDSITLSISDDTQVYLSTYGTEIDDGEEKPVKLLVADGAAIDREKQDKIAVTITLVDANNNTAEKEVTIRVIDRNDNVPQAEEGSCNVQGLVVSEDADNGTLIHTVVGTDADAENPHNIVVYALESDGLNDPESLSTPFRVDDSGKVTVFLDGVKKKLDRETKSSWDLYIQISDSCKPGGHQDCTVLWNKDDPCLVFVNVTDVNDNHPRDLTHVPPGLITVTEFMKENETVEPFIFTAKDDDYGDNARLDYTMLGTYLISDNTTDMDLFKIEDVETYNGEYSFELVAKSDFSGRELQGFYNVRILVEDNGYPRLEYQDEVTIQIIDANDQTPIFKLSGCEFEEEHTITMEELYYKPGEGQSEIVKCATSDEAGVLTITVVDSDLGINRQRVVSIDRQNSTVEPPGEGEGQLSAFKLKPIECDPHCNLYVTEQIHRKQGTAYNLSLHVVDQGNPPLESWHMLRVVVTVVHQYPPYFCDTGDYCTEALNMTENEPDATVTFKAAVDDDNYNMDEDDESYDKVYYHLVGGDKDYFMLNDSLQPVIRLKEGTDGLDRETKDTYLLKIDVSNTKQGSPDLSNSPIRNSTLYLTINVMDENDVAPTFNSSTYFASFMVNDQPGKTVTVIEADDPDLDELLIFTMSNLQWHNTTLRPEDPFKLERNSTKAYAVKLNFEPMAMTGGYCTFDLKATDEVQETGSTKVKLYAVTEFDRLQVFFNNEPEEVESKRPEVEGVFTEVFKYPCIITSVTSTMTSEGDIMPNRTTVLMHFINNVNNKPVPVDEILNMAHSSIVTEQLQNSLSELNIILRAVGEDGGNQDDGKDLQQTILMLEILLGVVGLVMLSLLILLITVYYLRTKSLQRKVKVLSTNTFGSKESGLNHIGAEMGPVPGNRNFVETHGNHNPVFNEQGIDFKAADTGSVSSGDSVLVGIEDNPEFKNYSVNNKLDNSITPHSTIGGGTRLNPLLAMDALKEDGDLSTGPSGLSGFRRESFGSESDADSFKQPNPNFSFSKM